MLINKWADEIIQNDDVPEDLFKKGVLSCYALFSLYGNPNNEGYMEPSMDDRKAYYYQKKAIELLNDAKEDTDKDDSLLCSLFIDLAVYFGSIEEAKFKDKWTNNMLIYKNLR